MTRPRARVIPAVDNEDCATLEGPTQPMQAIATVVRREAMQAREKAEAIEREARERMEAERQAVLEQARREGQEAAKADLAAAWLTFRSAQARAATDDLDRSIDVAGMIAERVLGETLAVRPETVVAIARQALAALARTDALVVHAHPADAQQLEASWQQLGVEPASVRVVREPGRKRGALLVECSDGEVRTDLDLQVERLVESLRRAMVTPDSGAR